MVGWDQAGFVTFVPAQLAPELSRHSSHPEVEVEVGFDG